MSLYSLNSFQFSARCLANTLGGVPLHQIDPFGCPRACRERDAAGVASAVLASRETVPNELTYAVAASEGVPPAARLQPFRRLANLLLQAAVLALMLPPRSAVRAKKC